MVEAKLAVLVIMSSWLLVGWSDRDPENTKAPVATDGGLRDRSADWLTARADSTPPSNNGGVGGRRCRMRGAWRTNARARSECQSPATSERQQNIHQLLTPSGVVDLGELATPAIGDPRLRHAVVQDGVVGRDVLRPDHPGHLQLTQLVVHPELLPRGDHQVAVRQHLRHHAGEPDRDQLVALDLPCPAVVVAAAHLQDLRRISDRLRQLRLEAEELCQTPVLGTGTGRRCRILHVGGVVHGDQDGDDVAHLRGALILEKRARAAPPQCIRLVRGRLAGRHRHGDGPPGRILGRIRGRRHCGRTADLRQPGERPTTGQHKAGQQGHQQMNVSLHRTLTFTGNAFGATRTRSGPITSASTTARDTGFRTRMRSPIAPASVAWPCAVSAIPGLSSTISTVAPFATIAGRISSASTSGWPAAICRFDCMPIASPGRRATSPRSAATCTRAMCTSSARSTLPAGSRVVATGNSTVSSTRPVTRIWI